MKLRLMLIACAMIAAISACAPPPELRNEAYLKDTSLIDGEPCSAPCWRGITPGETTWRDARTILEDDPTLADIKIESQEESEEVAATFQRVDGIPCCLLYSENGKMVDQMLFQLAPDIKLSQVLETHGDPEYLSLSEVSGDQAAVALYYPELQAIVYAFVAGKEQGALSPDSEIFAMLYVREEDVDLVIENSSLYAWEGYGTYLEYEGRTLVTTPVPTTDPAVATEEIPDSTETPEEAPEGTPEPTAES